VRDNARERGPSAEGTQEHIIARSETAARTGETYPWTHPSALDRTGTREQQPRADGGEGNVRDSRGGGGGAVVKGRRRGRQC
jgi:hypothetical protein